MALDGARVAAGPGLLAGQVATPSIVAPVLNLLHPSLPVVDLAYKRKPFLGIEAPLLGLL
jgi:hypothetical protein